MKLIQMLMATMITSQNIDYAISAFANNGTIENERAVTIAAIQGTLVGFVATLVISWLLAFCQSYRRKVMNMKIEVEKADNEDEVASVDSISDDDSSTFVSTPTRCSPGSFNKQSTTDDEMDEMEFTIDDDSEAAEVMWISSPRKSSLRLALRKHRGFGLDWNNSGQRYSLRFCSPSYISTHPNRQ